MRMLGREGRPPDPATAAPVSGVEAGVRGVASFAAAVESSRRDAARVGLEAQTARQSLLAAPTLAMQRLRPL